MTRTVKPSVYYNPNPASLRRKKPQCTAKGCNRDAVKRGGMCQPCMLIAAKGPKTKTE